MNQELLISEQEPYNLITITWADLQECAESGNFGNIIIKPDNNTVQYIQTPFTDDQLQSVIIENDKEQPIIKDNVATATEELSTFLTLPPTSTALPSQRETEEPAENAGPKKTPKRPVKLEKPINCPLCNKEFNKISHYRAHIQEHKNTKKFKCEHCSESYNVEKNFQVHMAMHQKGDPICPICNRKFQRLASLKAHLVMHQVEETYACNECLAEFDKEKEYNSHMEDHIKEKQEQSLGNLPLVCTYCGYSFQDSDEYKEHISLHIKAKRAVYSNKKSKKRNVNTNRDYQHKCEHCPKSFPKLCMLQRHVRIHTGERPYVCRICNRSFSQKASLQIHINKHEGKKPFECDFCGSKFTQKGNLRVHLERTHTARSPNEKMYRCIHCPCIFKKVASLNGHIARVHMSAFKKDSIDIKSLIDQLKKLDKEAGRPQARVDVLEDVELARQVENAGDETDNSFLKLADSSVDGSIRRYIIKQRRSGDTRWYICSYCTKEFKKPSDLIRHIRMHTMEKPFKCKECGQTFALKSTLKNHQNTHTRSTCECIICLKKFSSISTLNVHLRKHDKGAVAHKTRCYKCSVCDKTFVSLESANEHMEVHDVPDSVEINQEPPNIDLNLVMKQPLIETENGLLSVAAPKPKLPYATMEEYKDRPYKCHICNTAFLKNVHLKRHMFTHNGKRDFECEICNKRFVTKYALKEHLNYHTKTKNHECKFCKKRFYTNSILSRHLLMHSNQKPYICPYCKKRFKQAQFCRKHILKIHKKDLNESVLTLTETNEINLEPTKMIDLTDILEDPPFETLNSESMENLTPIEAYNTIPEIDSNITENSPAEQQQPIEVALPVAENEDDLIAENRAAVDKPNKAITSEENTNVIPLVTIENLQENSMNYPTIYISSEDLQLLSNPNVVNSLLPQLKLQNNDPLLLSSINELQDPNILYPLDTSTIPKESDPPAFDTFNANIIFNPATVGELNITEPPEKQTTEQTETAELTTEQIDLHLNEIASNRVLDDNLIIFNGDAQKTSSDMNYFNINFNQSDFIDINGLSLPAGEASMGKMIQPSLLDGTGNLMCPNCMAYFKSLEEFDEHVCDNVIGVEEERDVVVEEQRDVVIEERNDEKDEPVVVVEESMDVVSEEVVPEAEKEVVEECDEIIEAPKENNKEKEKTKKNGTFLCQYCNKTFHVNAALMRHISFKHKEKIDNSCSICTKKFKKHSDLVRHLRTHTGEKPFSCDKCDKSFSLKSTLMSHYRTHNPLVSKEFKCQVCDTYVSCKSSLKAHMILHTDVKRFECSICAMKFRTSHQRKSHIATQHSDKNAAVGNKVNSVNLLESMLLETNNEIQNLNAEEKEQELTESNYQESTQNLIPSELPMDNLVLSDVHLDPILLQLPPNNYPMGLQLEIDGQLISVKQNSDGTIEQFEPSAEVPVVEAPKKVQCDICSKTYSSRSVLSKHKRLLHGQYKCDKCSKTFNSEELLEKHSRLHFGYRPFSCSLCANSFTEMSNLKVHMRRIHNTVMN